MSVQGEITAALEAFHRDEANLQELLDGPNGAVARDLIHRAMRVEQAAKQNATGRPGPNVRTGRLRSSITWRLGSDSSGLYADVGTAVSYCVFGAKTPVLTDRGAVGIGSLLPGDRVMTQSGEFHRVLAVSSFPAIEKPDLVDLVVPWRADRAHRRLTLTLDHKALCFRDGRNQWIAAGDLRSGDEVYDRAKIATNKGTRKRPLKVCEWCTRTHTNQGRRYCSMKCRDAHYATGANPHLGMKRSAETRRRISEAQTRNGTGVRLNRMLGQRGYRTQHEREVEEWLQTRGVVYECQYEIGRHVVDFYLPERREVIEADGAYWHRDQHKDIARDRELMADAPGVEITHLHFHSPRFSPSSMDTEPLPGVRYVVCNPGPSSYVDPVAFRRRPVQIERMWRYGDDLKPKGTLQARLYDVSVEGVHSFLANSVIVSNSVYLELGTSRMPAYPFLVPALEAANE